ncbi:MgtC/SapB family protein [Minwuia sp.]|uniref:MgtC/SapB family protein n=1 Tax=Minwuia sp. TaxID=2493630 RepID=UPI003A9090BE
MAQLEAFLNLNVVPWEEAILRLVLAMLFGLMLGLDRDTKNKPVGFRAFMIVSTTTCLMAMVGVELSAAQASARDGTGLDLAKIISGVLTGIGFLGAGAILHGKGKQVIGAATGASIWACGGIGLALGFGLYLFALFGFVAIGIILVVGGWLQVPINGETDDEEK